MFRFEKLEIWKLANQYARQCYFLADKFPSKEKYALADQLRRAAISISNNIAEGSAFTIPKFKNFLDISIGSALETVNILDFALGMGYILGRDKEIMYRQAETLIKKIYSLKRSLKQP